MKAIVINKYGVADAVFESAEMPVPVIASDEVLVKVMATSADIQCLHHEIANELGVKTYFTILFINQKCFSSLTHYTGFSFQFT